MKTKLIEFKNSKNETLRGLLTLPEETPKEGIIFIHGFERTTITEKKFKVLADELSTKNLATFRFDFPGCGISDGSFKEMTVKSMAIDLKIALEEFKKNINLEKVSVVAHSLGSCVVSDYIKDYGNPFSKIVLIGPALNQKDIQRFYYSISFNKKNNPSLKITWQNFKENFNEEEFLKDTEKEERETKGNIIGNNYFIETRDKDYSETFENFKEKTLLIHGLKDDKVPFESLNIDFSNKIILEEGDHDLEKPSVRKFWIEKVVNFLIKKL